MALANAACLLARRTGVKRILAIDWDLDAPGLPYFFSGVSATYASESHEVRRLGVVDLFRDLSRRIKQEPRQPVSEERAAKLLEETDLAEFVVPTEFQNVDLLAAGRIDHREPGTADVDWRGLFDAAPTLIRLFAERLAQRYDYVLVDSRTGLNDVSGICTTLMPDQLVFVFTPNRQNIDGGLEVLRKAARYRTESDDLRPLVIFPLQSRLELSEPELLSAWRFGSGYPDKNIGYQARFESLFSEIYDLPQCDLKSYFDEVQIQHVPRYSYGEVLAAVAERGQGTRLSLSRSYAAFVDVLATQDGPWKVKASTDHGADLLSDVKPTSTKVNSAKEYVTDERLKVKLYDLVADEVRIVLPAINQIASRDNQVPWSIEGFEERLRSYETATNDLLHIEAVLGFWGDEFHSNVLSLGPKRIVANLKPASGLTVYLATRWYPLMLLSYAAGVSAVANNRYSNLKTVFSIRVPDGYESQDLLGAIAKAAGELGSAFANLPLYNQRQTPRSDYFYQLLQPILDDAVFVGSDYDDAFDRFELLFALEYAYRSSLKELGRVWGPPGRFVWKPGGADSPFLRLTTEAERQGDQWAPLKAGFFGGSTENLKKTITAYREAIGRHGFG